MLPIFSSESVSTSKSATDKLVREDGTALGEEDAFTYRSMVGGLQYLTLTGPDIALLSTKCANIFPNQLIYIGKQSSVFYVMLRARLLQVFTYDALLQLS